MSHFGGGRYFSFKIGSMISAFSRKWMWLRSFTLEKARRMVMGA
jgi:hypothetical protein